MVEASRQKIAGAWVAFIVVVGCIAPFIDLFAQQFILYIVVEGIAFVSITIAALKHRSKPLCLLWAALVSFWTGDLLYVYFDLIQHDPRSFPNIGDVFYLAFYPLAIAALWLFVRDGKAVILDVALLTLGTAIPWWIFVEYPLLSANGFTFIEQFVSVIYPLGDIVLLFSAVRILFFKVPRSLIYLAAAALILTLTDSVYSIQQLNGVFLHGSYLDYGWYLFYALFAMAFLFPLPRTDFYQTHSFSSANTVLLLVGSILVPVGAVVIELSMSDVASPAQTCGTLFLTVMIAAGTLYRIRSIQTYEMPEVTTSGDAERTIAELEKRIKSLSMDVDKPASPDVE